MKAAAMRHAFDAVIENVEAHADDNPPAPPRVVASLPAGEEAARFGSHSLWDMAAEWTPQADPPRPKPPEPPAPPPSADPDDIARELRLGDLQTPAAVAQARRRFMWLNHPDRRADLDRTLANRRVAIANMLLDRTARELAGKRSR